MSFLTIFTLFLTTQLAIFTAQKSWNTKIFTKYVDIDEIKLFQRILRVLNQLLDTFQA